MVDMSSTDITTTGISGASDNVSPQRVNANERLVHVHASSV